MSNRALVGAVTSYANNGSGSTIPFSARAVRAGSLLVAMVRSESAQRTTTWSDTAGGIWTSFDNFQSNINCSIAYSWNHPGGSAVSVTATLSVANSYRYGELVELEGPDAVDPVGFITRLNSTTTQRVWAQHRPRSDLLFGVAVYNGGSVFPVPPDAVQVNKGPYHALLMRRATGGGSSLVSGGDYVTNTAGVVLEIRDRSARRWRARRGAVSAGGGTSLTVADAAHAHTLDAVVLTTSTALVVQDMAHGHALDAVTLSTGTALAVADSLHAHALDNVTLSTTGAVSLTVADSLHAHTLDAVVLTSQTDLAAADMAHGHALDGVTLTLGGISLVIAEIMHAHALDNVALTLDTYLAVADLLHAHTLDNVLVSIPGGTLDLILKILVNRQELNPATGTFTLYDDDGVTVLYTTSAWADAAGTVPYSGGALRRIDALF